MSKRIERCVVSGKKGADLHHLLSRKAYPEYKNESWNIIPVGRDIHNEFHNHGIWWVAEKYLQVKLFLFNAGWIRDEEKKEYKAPKVLQSRR